MYQRIAMWKEGFVILKRVLNCHQARVIDSAESYWADTLGLTVWVQYKGFCIFRVQLQKIERQILL